MAHTLKGVPKMARKPTSEATPSVPKYTGPPLRAAVSFDLTASEIEDLLDACANQGLMRLGMRIAERKSRLVANIRRMEKEAALLQVTSE